MAAMALADTPPEATDMLENGFFEGPRGKLPAPLDGLR